MERKHQILEKRREGMKSVKANRGGDIIACLQGTTGVRDLIEKRVKGSCKGIMIINHTI